MTVNNILNDFIIEGAEESAEESVRQLEIGGPDKTTAPSLIGAPQLIDETEDENWSQEAMLFQIEEINNTVKKITCAV